MSVLKLIRFVKKAGSTEEEAVRIVKETGLDTNEQRVEITDSSHDHDKSSSSNSSSSGSGSGSSSSDDDESHEVKEETEVIITVPSQPVPVAGDAPFIGSTANAIVENAGLMDSTTPSDPETENIVVTSSAAEASLASDESKQASSSTTGSDKKELKKCVPEGSKESQVVISHVEEVRFSLLNLFWIVLTMFTNKKTKLSCSRRIPCDQHMELRKEPHG